MTALERLEHWGDAHHPKWLDIIRIVLGIFLCYKGYDFLQNSSTIAGALSTKTSFGNFTVIAVSHYVVFAHIIGGILLIIGFLTRFACLIQIPILLGAIIFINLASDVLKPYNELFFICNGITVVMLFFNCRQWPMGIEDQRE